jgi:hypothetical protein
MSSTDLEKNSFSQEENVHPAGHRYHKGDDEAFKILEHSAAVPYTEAEAKGLRRKADLLYIPIVSIFFRHWFVRKFTRLVRSQLMIVWGLQQSDKAA